MKPCVLALAASRLPSKRWTTRAELIERLDTARGLLEGDVHGRLSVSWLAGQCFLSQAHFVRIFTETYGVSPSVYRSRARLAYARDLLRQGVSPGQAALAIGRFSASSFSRDFRVAFGMSPTEFLKIARSGTSGRDERGLE